MHHHDRALIHEGGDRHRSFVGQHATALAVDHATGSTTIHGFAFGSDNVSVYSSGLYVTNGTGHQIFCNHFSLNASGDSHLGTSDLPVQILLENEASGVIIGTNGDGFNDVAERNVFGGAGASAVYINGDAGNHDNWVAGNYFGFTADGSSQVEAGYVYMRQISVGNLVGTNEDGTSDDLERNLFGGSTGVRFDANFYYPTDNEIVGNVFGVTPSGLPASIDTGIEVVGLTSGATGNRISSNYFASAATGVSISGDDSGAGVLVSDNVFGTTPVGDGQPNATAIALIGSGSSVVKDNSISGAATAGLTLTDSAGLGTGSTGNCFVDNAAGATNSTGTGVTLESNWWGSSTGPSGAGPGSGDSVSVDIDYDPWLTSPPAACSPPVAISDAVFSVAENAAPGTEVGTVAATGVGTLSYSITGGNGGAVFAIGSNTGVITTAAALDYETTPSYSLTVEVTNGSESDVATVTIDVTDVFELPASPTFGDVPTTHTFFGDVEWLAAQGITKGCNPPANDQYCPNDPVTRGQMAAFLHRGLSRVLTPDAPLSFTDISGSVFKADIEWLGSVGVTKGCNPPANDQYCPNDPVTRGQMAAFLVRAFGYTTGAGSDRFRDDDGSIFEADIERLAEAGVTRGCNPPTNDMFCPNDPVTRAQMAAFLHRAMGP